MNTNERILRNESCSACMHGEEEHARAGDAGRDVAEHVDLRAPRAHRLVLQHDGHAAGLQRRAHRLAHVDLAWRLRPRSSWPWVFSRRLSCATTRCTAARSCSGPRGQRAVELVERPGGRQRLGALDLARARARGAAAPRSRGSPRAAGPRARGSSGGRSGWGSARRPSARRMRWTSTPITPEPSPWRPNAAIARRARSRMRALVAVAQRRGDLLAQRRRGSSSAPALVACLAGAVLADALAHGRQLGGTEEEAVEDEVEDAAVLGRLGQRRGERLAEVLALGPRDCSSAANASSSSLVPTATPSPRSSSPNSSSARPCRGAGPTARPAPEGAAPGRLAGGRGTAAAPSFTPTRSATMSRSVRCLTMIAIVCGTSRRRCRRRRAAAARAPSRWTPRSTAAS